MKAAIGIVCYMLLTYAAVAQTPSPSAQGALSFDVASVRPSRADEPTDSNVPLNAGDMYAPNGGLFSATNFPLVSYIFFAYKLQGNEGLPLEHQLPNWALTEGFDIQARAAGNPTKDQMRLMMRSLLAERFKFAVHTDMQERPVLALVLVKPGKTGPQLQPNSAGAPCVAGAAKPTATTSIPDSFRQMTAGGFPPLCGNILGLPPSVPGRSRLAGRNVTIAAMADMLSQRVDPGRPMIDGTGLEGKFDFMLEYTPESQDAAPATLNAAHDNDGPTFDEALHDLLGLKLQARKSSIAVIVLDHVERPSAN